MSSRRNLVFVAPPPDWPKSQTMRRKCVLTILISPPLKSGRVLGSAPFAIWKQRLRCHGNQSVNNRRCCGRERGSESSCSFKALCRTFLTSRRFQSCRQHQEEVGGAGGGHCPPHLGETHVQLSFRRIFSVSVSSRRTCSPAPVKASLIDLLLSRAANHSGGAEPHRAAGGGAPPPGG